MPRVELDKIKIGISPLTNTVYVGTTKAIKAGKKTAEIWNCQQDVTQNFNQVLLNITQDNPYIIECTDKRTGKIEVIEISASVRAVKGACDERRTI